MAQVKLSPEPANTITEAKAMADNGDVPMMEANVYKIYEENGSLKFDYLSKNACSGSIKRSRKKIISASLDEEKLGIFMPRKIRILLLCDDGMAPDKGQWLFVTTVWPICAQTMCRLNQF